ncbi:MAG: IS66 family transposase [Proteobacteria bacterium]|nr:IS66 family transposase [Pseudomonadota bacterium]
MSKSMEELYKIIDELRSIIDKQAKRIEELEASNAQKDAEIASLKKKLYGTGKSEKIDPKQEELFDKDEIELSRPNDDKLVEFEISYTRKEGKKPKLSKESKYQHLPTKEEIVYIPEEVQKNPDQYEEIGEETTFEIEPESNRFFKIIHKRIKYKKKDDRSQAPLVEAAPKQLVQGSIASTGWVVQIILDKYLDHLPLDRQCAIAKRIGVEVTTKNMCDWLEKAGNALEGIYNKILDMLKLENYLQADETPIDYIPDKPPKERCKKGCKLGYFWLLNDPSSYVYYHWSTTRSASVMTDLLGSNWNGLLQCDGYPSYKSWVNNEVNLSRLGSCLVHIRRKFKEAYERGERKYSPWFLRKIALIYHWEESCRDQSVKEREAVRSSHYPFVFNQILRYMKHIQANQRVLPQSKMGRAIHYGLDQWEGLQECLKDGRIELDNNRIENAVRPTKIGLKNWLFIGHQNAGKRAAIFYTLIENCKRLKIPTATYLKDVLNQIIQYPSFDQVDYEKLLPKNWIKQNPEKMTPFQVAA